MSTLSGGLKRSRQHSILDRRDGVFNDVPKISSGFFIGREDGVMGSLATRGIAEGDWSGIWQAIVVHLFPGSPLWRDSSCTTASVAVGIDAFGARGDLERPCSPSIGAIDSAETGSLGLDGEPRAAPQWWL